LPHFKNNDLITAILLAAGGSSRLGQPKQLVLFKNEFLINYIIDQIGRGGISDIRIVLGSHFSEIKEHIKNKKLEIIQNPDWKEGISSSIKYGLSNLRTGTEAVLIFIVDQPFLNPKLIVKIMDKFGISKANIIAACVSGQIVHPVLYRKDVFAKLMELKGDIGGKAIFGKETVETINWEDERLLLDIDSISDLEKINNLIN
jgi:molybdenum cofactor cytidylyltransferase